MSASTWAAAKKTVDATTVATAKAIRYPVVGAKVLQGKLRHPGSKAADDYRLRESARLRKALQSITHGRHIFAYNHIRTNQVVYSLSRTLDVSNEPPTREEKQFSDPFPQNSVLSQLVYHGKKTVPARLRKDMWSPYFSLHFASSRTGLEVYRLLREFSMLRQFSPPEDMVKVTKEWLDRKRPRNPNDAKKFDEENEWKLGYFLPQKDRARVLMDQKVSSVADAATALDIVFEDEHRRLSEAKLKEQRRQKSKELAELKAAAEANGESLPEEALQLEKELQSFTEATKQKKKLGKAARAKAIMQKRRDEVKGKEMRTRLQGLESALATELNVHEKHIEDHENKEAISSIKLATYDESTPHHNIPEGHARAFWVDMADARYANNWPDNVRHGKLKPSREHIIEYLLDKEDMEAAAAEAKAQELPDSESQTAAASDPQSENPGESKPEPLEGETEKPSSVLDKLRFWKS
ncbi:hypothetical protein KEM56_006254 [Ascosphaera pollenicola]|nr:hypothetical protein KEM56_006254 [Ascosphaera pollenicola]